MPGLGWEHLGYPRLLRTPRRPSGAVRRLQERQLIRIGAHARAHVPYYHDLFRSAGFGPDDPLTLEALPALPLTSKDRLRELSAAEITADNVDLSRCVSHASSGTTGIPLTTPFTRADNTMMNLGWFRAQSYGGRRPWHKLAAFNRQPPVPRTPSSYERFGLWRRLELSSWDEPRTWVEALSEWRPDFLMGNVNILKILAEALTANGKRLSLRGIFHCSELLDGTSRRLLEERMGCGVLDFYGSREAGCIAWECPVCAGYHIASDLVVVEILKEGRPAAPGESGEVVVTNLHSHALPFIRFRQGDFAVLSEREPVCGVSLPLLERIEGRILDALVLPGRGRISPHLVFHLLDPLPGLARWRIIQVDPMRLRVECEPGGAEPSELRARVEAGLRHLVPSEVSLDIVILDRIPVPPGQKFRPVVSMLGRPVA
jgi:phenylacetate-CoA ligase